MHQRQKCRTLKSNKPLLKPELPAVAMTKIKIVVDTNWWVSFAMKPASSQFAEVLLHPEIEIIASQELENEVFEVIHRPVLAKYFAQTSLAEFKEIFAKATVKQKVKSKVDVCRDPDDNYLLALALDGKADFLVTGDKDLLDIGTFQGTRIVRMAELLEMI